MSTSFPKANAAAHPSKKDLDKLLVNPLAVTKSGGIIQYSIPGSQRYNGNLCRYFSTDLRECSQKRLVRIMGKMKEEKGSHCEKGLELCPDLPLHLLCRTKALICFGGGGGNEH